MAPGKKRLKIENLWNLLSGKRQVFFVSQDTFQHTLLYANEWLRAGLQRAQEPIIDVKFGNLVPSPPLDRGKGCNQVNSPVTPH